MKTSRSNDYLIASSRELVPQDRVVAEIENSID